MKKNKINKRLAFNKTTIADLSDQMDGIKGGETQLIPTVCVSVTPNCPGRTSVTYMCVMTDLCICLTAETCS
jgi:hypothetical protein